MVGVGKHARHRGAQLMYGTRRTAHPVEIEAPLDVCGPHLAQFHPSHRRQDVPADMAFVFGATAGTRVILGREVREPSLSELLDCYLRREGIVAGIEATERLAQRLVGRFARREP